MPPTLVMGGEQLSGYGWSGDHPFGLDRHGAFEQAMRKLDFGDAVRFESAPLADMEQLERFHSPEYLEFVGRRCEENQGFLDGGDTPARNGLFEAARHVVGAALHATEAIMQGRVGNAFLPIGGLHHAGREHAAGFCVLNDIGVVIETLRAVHGVQRIAYVDIDVHHGDGVFYAYEEDPLLYFADIHEDGRWQYPGTGGENERGRGPGRGSKINLCLQPGEGDSQFLARIRKGRGARSRMRARIHTAAVRRRRIAGRPAGQAELQCRGARSCGEKHVRIGAIRLPGDGSWPWAGGGYSRENPGFGLDRGGQEPGRRPIAVR